MQRTVVANALRSNPKLRQWVRGLVTVMWTVGISSRLVFGYVSYLCPIGCAKQCVGPSVQGRIRIG
jgi:hypothetical protein